MRRLKNLSFLWRNIFRGPPHAVSCNQTGDQSFAAISSFLKHLRVLSFAKAILLFIFVSIQSLALADSKVTFDSNGIAQVDGKPFFPIGVFTYELNPEVLAELRELQCNTVLNGFATNQLDLIEQRGLMAVCFADPPWMQVAQHHPALLGWYLADEPEGRLKPEDLRKRYSELKAADPNHPIGLCHTVYEALAQFKDDCDFT